MESEQTTSTQPVNSAEEIEVAVLEGTIPADCLEEVAVSNDNVEEGQLTEKVQILPSIRPSIHPSFHPSILPIHPPIHSSI